MGQKKLFDCPACEGSGKILESPLDIEDAWERDCEYCEGTGKIKGSSQKKADDTYFNQ